MGETTQSKQACAPQATSQDAADTRGDRDHAVGGRIDKAPEWVKDAIRAHRNVGSSLRDIVKVLGTGGFITTEWHVSIWCTEHEISKKRIPTGKGRSSRVIESWPEQERTYIRNQWESGTVSGRQISEAMRRKGFHATSDQISSYCRGTIEMFPNNPPCLSLPLHTKRVISPPKQAPLRPYVPNNLWLYRMKESYTQKDLATLIGVGNETLGKIERGCDMTLDLDTAVKFQKAIGQHCTLKWMQRVVAWPEYA